MGRPCYNPGMLSYVYLAVGLLAWIAAIIHWRRVSTWLARAHRCEARVQRLEGARPGDPLPPAGSIKPGMTVFPVVRFELDGTLQETRARMGMPYRSLQDRRTLQVLVSPDNPEDVRLGDHADRSLSFTLGGMGLIVVVIGVLGVL